MCLQVYCLGSRPDLQDELYNEVCRVVGDLSSEEISSEHLRELKLVRAVLDETLRMYPPAPSIDRFSPRATTIQGEPVPAGAAVHLFFYLAQMDEAEFSSPDEFRPARWLDGAKTHHPFAYSPFSAGSRNCIGQKLAQHEAIVLLAHLVSALRWSLVDGDQVKAALVAVSEPKNLKVKFVERQ